MTFNEKCIQGKVSLMNESGLALHSCAVYGNQVSSECIPLYLMSAWLAWGGVTCLGRAASQWLRHSGASAPSAHLSRLWTHEQINYWLLYAWQHPWPSQCSRQAQGNEPLLPKRTGGAATDAPFHLLSGDLLARGAVGDLISQLISLLLGMSAGSLRWGKFLNKFRPWFKLWLLIVSSIVKSDNAYRL